MCLPGLNAQLKFIAVAVSSLGTKIGTLFYFISKRWKRQMLENNVTFGINVIIKQLRCLTFSSEC